MIAPGAEVLTFIQSCWPFLLDPFRPVRAKRKAGRSTLYLSLGLYGVSGRPDDD